MSTPPAELPKRRPLRTREEILQEGRQHGEGGWPPAEPTERLAALLMLAFPDKPDATEPLDGTDGPAAR